MKKSTQKLTSRGKIIAVSIGAILVIALAWWWLFPPNPLLGKWVAIDRDSDPYRVSVTVIGQLEFTPDTMIQHNGRFPARYDVSRSRVVVHTIGFADGKDIAEAYTIKRTIKGIIIQRPMSFLPDGVVEYRKAD